MENPIIVACDFKSKADLEVFLKPFNEKPLFLKVGMEMFYKEGRELVVDLKRRGYRIFLDLKLHDIPNTVASALNVLKDLDVDFITIHAQGGVDMMRAAANAVAGTNTKLLAVSVLTSIDEQGLVEELQVNESLSNYALHLANLAKQAGIHGCICSPHEVKSIREALGETFVCVTPGIRLESGDVHDQKRIMTPLEAMKQGANHLVIGRAITNAANPKEIYETIEVSLCQK